VERGFAVKVTFLSLWRQLWRHQCCSVPLTYLLDLLRLPYIEDVLTGVAKVTMT